MLGLKSFILELKIISFWKIVFINVLMSQFLCVLFFNRDFHLKFPLSNRDLSFSLSIRRTILHKRENKFTLYNTTN